MDVNADEKRMQSRRTDFKHADGHQRGLKSDDRSDPHGDWRDPRDRDTDRNLADRDEEE